MSMRSGVTVITMFLVLGACSGAEDATLYDEDVGWGEQGLPKPRGTNGARDYCNNPSSPCLSSEGDCDADAQCVAGVVCATNVGPQFFLPVGWDVCVPAHCANGQLDGDETALDCGGSCSAPGFACSSRCQVLPVGHAEYCSAVCPCAAGEGDCDIASDCEPGLTCGRNNGPNFGLPSAYDVCVKAHCDNRVLDASETFPDCGGECSTPDFDCNVLCDRFPPGHSNHCSSACRCVSGEGDCDGTAQCQAGLVCGTNNGPKFGLPSDYDVCVPAHCNNGVRDPDESSTDCGGPCSTSMFECSQSSCPTDATYAIELSGTITDMWPLSWEELLGCHIQHWSTRRPAEVRLSNGNVRITSDDYVGFDQVYPIVQETDTSLVAQLGQPWEVDVVMCGYTDFAEYTGGSVTIRIDCTADIATVEAYCWGDNSADGCYPNDEEFWQGTGPRVPE